MLFTDESKFFEKKRADILVIATLDKDHIRQAVKGLELGYDLLLEKPITDEIKECKLILDAQKKYGGKVLVCHVLRYAPAFMKVAELLDNGEIGKLVAIQALEQVEYAHQAHSYVRGNWRRKEDTSAMIIAKCCHDLDLLQFYAKSKCKDISSIGELAYFKPENKPEGAADRCVNCKYKDTCTYSAKKIYVDLWKEKGSPANIWPQNIITVASPLTEEAIYKAIEEGPYGRCVFACDNDVVDHQITQMTFENGVKATLTMTAFTALGGRKMTFFGTDGDIILDEETNTVTLRKFGKPVKVFDIIINNEGGYAHGGGDEGLVTKLYDVLTGNATNETSLEASIESHLMGIYAEKSRVKGGKLLRIHK